MVELPQHELPITTLLVEIANELRSNDTVVRWRADSGPRWKCDSTRRLLWMHRAHLAR